MIDYNDQDSAAEKDERRERFERKKNYTTASHNRAIPKRHFEERVLRRQPYKRTKINYDDLLNNDEE